MNTIFRIGLGSVTVLLAGNAFAQGPAGATPAPGADAHAAPAPAAVASPEPTLAAPVAAPHVGGIACVMGEHPADYPDSTRTATRMVCDALRDRGVHVGDVQSDAAGASSAYVVNVDQLGSTFYLRVNYEEPVGTIKSTQRLSLRDFSEAEVAAPRIASAFTGGEKIDESHYEDVVGTESREYQKKRGEIVVGGGIAAMSMPTAGSYMGPAFHLFGFYETKDWGLGIQAHIGDADNRHHHSAEFAALSVGARYYFSNGNITPLVGGGLAMSSIHESDPNSPDITGSGTSAFGEVGVEFFRLHKTHLIAALRVDAPMYKLDNDNSRSYYYPGTYDYNTGMSTPSMDYAHKERYEIPISLNVGIGF